MSYVAGFGQPAPLAYSLGARVATALERMDALPQALPDVAQATTLPWGCADGSAFCIPLDQYQRWLASQLNALRDPLATAYQANRGLQQIRADVPAEAKQAQGAWDRVVTEVEYLTNWVRKARLTRVGDDRLPSWRPGSTPHSGWNQRVNEADQTLAEQHFNPRVGGVASFFGQSISLTPGFISLDAARNQEFINLLKMRDLKRALVVIHTQQQYAAATQQERASEHGLPSVITPPVATPPAPVTHTSTAPLLALAAAAGIGWWLWNRGVESPQP